MKLPLKALLPVVVGLALAALPVPAGLAPYAWHYFAIFAAVVVGLVFEPIPAAAIGVMGVTLAALFRLVPVKPPTPPTTSQAISWALSGFSNGTVWLIFIAFMFALGYEKTGLGRRISLTLIKVLGKKTLGLGYAVACADAVLAPFMPSNTARSGGTIFPIIKNIPPLYGSTPDNEPRKIGSYIMWVALATTCVTSSLFLTGLAPNLLAVSVIEKTANIRLDWTTWFVAIAPVGIILFLAVPLLSYFIYPPTQKESADAPIWAGKELEAMGPISRKELTMAGLALFALLLWIFGGKFLNSTTTAFIALCLMLLFKVITWDDLLANKQAWNVLMWFATLVALAGGLAKTGFLTWFAQGVAAHLAGYSLTTVMVALVVVFFAIHYIFASVTAHVTALMAVFLTAAAAVPGMNMKVMALMLGTSLGIMGILTPFATGPSPIYYGSGYIPAKDFWRLGFIFGLIFLGVFLAVGIPWMLTMGG
ncbi:anion transporter [Solidesulfovibrio fructosivorans JJ]]|uniref:Anion transporter n=1 Tax=Solidesulfovibrio fructosivorans JJ] TaxID=596151 RepID=E1JVR9_SOLFR|nr:anion permease [Solidesulfovibrio fructosivorans]EFL51557.1 anion transporter [Solidesulfovibrio fructosivorans JJ]]